MSTQWLAWLRKTGLFLIAASISVAALKGIDTLTDWWLGPRQRHDVMNVAMSVGLAFAAVIGVCLFVLWYASAGVIDDHEDRITGHDDQLATLAYQMPALLEFLGVEIPAPVVDDSPEAEEAEVEEEDDYEDDANGENAWPDDDTDEIPVAPPTVPDGMPLAVQSALLRPSPVPRDLSGEFPQPVDSDERKAQNAADIEERLKQFNFTGGRK